MAHFFISNHKVTQKSFHNNHYPKKKYFFLKKCGKHDQIVGVKVLRASPSQSLSPSEEGVKVLRASVSQSPEQPCSPVIGDTVVETEKIEKNTKLSQSCP